MPKVDLAQDVALTSWTATDGTLTNITTCMTDGNFATNCGGLISPTNGLRVGINLDPAIIAGFRLVLRLGLGMGTVAGNLAMLAYNSSTTVTTTAKVVVNATGTGSYSFVAPQAFVDELADLGGGSFAVRIVPDLGGSARVNKREGEYARVNRKVSKADEVELTSWNGTDGTLTDETSCMTDSEVGTKCGDKIRDDVGSRLEVPIAPSAIHGFAIELTVEQGGMDNPGDCAMLAYTSASAVTTTSKVVLNVNGDAVYKFVAPQAFVNQLTDLGGKFAVRLVADLGGGLTAEKHEAEYSDLVNLVAFSSEGLAEFAAALDGGRCYVAPTTVAANFTVAAAEVERGCAVSAQVNADFQASVQVEKALAAASQADADFAQQLETERTIAASLESLAELAQQVTRERGVATSVAALADLDQSLSLESARSFALVVSPDFAIRLDGLQRRFECDNVVSVDVAAGLTVDKVLAANVVSTAVFAASFEREREVATALEALAELSQAIEVERPLEVDLEALVVQNALLEIDDRLLRANVTADADFTVTLGEVDRPLELALTADADFTDALTVEKLFVEDVDVATDFTVALTEVERPLSVTFDALAQLAAELDAGRNLVADVDADADFTVGPLTRLVQRFVDVRVDADFQVSPSYDHELAFALDVQADFVENFVSASRLIFADWDADVDLEQQLDRQPGCAAFATALANFQVEEPLLDLSLVVDALVDADFLIDTILNENELAISLTANADFLMEFETDRLPGVNANAQAFVVPNLQTGAFVVPGTREFTVSTT